jgi:tripartite-type tricarboxylate transporter receptor subunit TctC
MLNHSRRWIGRSIALLAFVAFSGPAMAQGYPTRPITLIVPFAAGGAADVTGRILADAMGKAIGQTIVVENVGGAGGATGGARTKNAAPDGYTIGLGHSGTHAASVTVNPRLPYNPTSDFNYLGLVAVTPNIIFVRNDFPAKDLKEFIAVAKEKQDKLSFGHSGNGAASHTTCLMFFGLIGVQPTYIPYRGYGQTVNDIISSKVDGSCDLVASATGHVQGKAVRALVVGAKERSESVPDVPTAAEAGLPEFLLETWTGLFAPKNTPKDIMDKLNDAYSKAVADPDVKQKLVAIGARPPKPEERGGAYMQKLVEVETDRWASILAKAGFKPE